MVAKMKPPRAGSLAATSSASWRTAAQIGSTVATLARRALSDFAAMVVFSSGQRSAFAKRGNVAPQASQSGEAGEARGHGRGCQRPRPRGDLQGPQNRAPAARLA